MFRNPLIDGLVVIVVLLLIVGPKKLPQLGRGLGDGMREFKDGITGDHGGDKEQDEPKLSLSPAPPSANATNTQQRPAESARESGSERSA